MWAAEKKTVLAFCAMLAFVFLVYSNHFRNPFHFDDSHTIIDNPFIRDLGNIGLFFSNPQTFSTLPANRVYRPVVSTSLAIDYRLAGGLNPVYFQVSTFVWFLLQLVLMYALFRALCDLALPDERNRWFALFAAGLYGVHPAMAETVNYVIQRGEVYSTLGVVAGLVIYIKAPGWQKYGLYLIPVALGILSKPPALIFPAILFVYLRLFEKERLSRAFVRSAPALLLAVVLAGLLSAMVPATYQPGAGSAYAYRITQPLVTLRYFRTFFLPNQLSADTDYRPLNGLMEGDALVGFAFVAGLIATAIRCAKERRWLPSAFGLWWFVLALVPTAVFPLAEVENDHRMFFPFVGLSLAVCWPATVRLYARPLGRTLGTATAVLAVGVLAVYGWGTRQRNEVWRSDETLWHDVTVKSPRNGRGLMNYGLTRMEKGEFQNALNYFEQAAVYNPAYYVLEINRGIANGALNRDAVAEAHFQRAISLAPSEALSYYYYARWLQQKNRKPEAIGHLRSAVAANPDYMPARYLLMEVHASLFDWPELQRTAESTLARFPGDATASAFLSRAATGAISPRTPEDYLNLSLSYHQAGKYRESLAAAQEALKLRPDYAEAYNNIAAAYEAMQMWDPAIEAARQALRIRPDFELARNNLLWSEEQKRNAAKGR